MTPNFERIDEVMQFIEDHPEQHDQDSWGVKNACGTTMCFAGWAVQMYNPEMLFWYDQEYSSLADVKPNSMLSFMGQARSVLGLRADQASALFYSASTIEHLKSLVKQLHNDPDCVPTID